MERLDIRGFLCKYRSTWVEGLGLFCSCSVLANLDIYYVLSHFSIYSFFFFHWHQDLWPLLWRPRYNTSSTNGALQCLLSRGAAPPTKTHHCGSICCCISKNNGRAAFLTLHSSTNNRVHVKNTNESEQKIHSSGESMKMKESLLLSRCIDIHYDNSVRIDREER